MNQANQTKKGKGGYEPWRNRERHYCAVCNVWMGSDRQSILLHENGKKHKENVQKAEQQKRQDRLDEAKQAQKIQASLKAIESAALQSHVQDIGKFAYNTNTTETGTFCTPIPAPAPVAPAPPSAPAPPASSKRKVNQEKKEWESRKKHRQEEKDKDNDGENDSSANQRKQQRVKIGENEGFYTLGNVSVKRTASGGEDPAADPAKSSSQSTTTTYLEGPVFGDLLEEDMPIQIWTGSNAASAAEQRLVQYHHLWLDGLVAAVRPRHDRNQNHADRSVVDVAYLQQASDAEETLETSVPLRRIRIVLGADEKIPATLEEARIMAMGGEEEVVVNNNSNNGGGEAMDEATGLSGWSTVSVKRTTVRQELKDERERLRQARKEAATKAETEQKEASLRRMEEAKTMNADDSALGAYDVWSRGSKEGYKGVNIHGEVQVAAHELGKKLATEGTSVAFKKVAGAFKGKQKKKKQNRRTTSADD